MRRVPRAIPTRALLSPPVSSISTTSTSQCLLRPSPRACTASARKFSTSPANFAEAAAPPSANLKTKGKSSKKSSIEERVKGMLLKKEKEQTLGKEWDGYVAATDGRGLKVVGIKELTEDAEEWVVQRFFPEALNRKKASKAVIYSKVRRAVVEEYALKLFPDLRTKSKYRSAARLVEEGHDYTADVKLERNGNSELIVDFASEDVVRNILARRFEHSSKQRNSTGFVDLQDESSVQGQVDFQASWLDAPFADEDVKFKIFKRIFQLTGVPIPQRDLNTINTPGQAIDSLLTPPKIAKLAERLLDEEDSSLTALPNVKIHSSRLTKVVREKEIGRDHPSLSRKLTREANFKKKGKDEDAKDALAKLEYCYPYIEKRLPGGDAVRVHTQGGNKWDGKMEIGKKL